MEFSQCGNLLHTSVEKFIYREIYNLARCVNKWFVCVLQHAQAPEEAGLQRPALRQEEGLAGPQRDQ